MQLNFDNHLFRVSSLTHIMSGYKTYMDSYLVAKEKRFSAQKKFEKAQQECEAMNPETIAAQKKEVVVANLSKKWNDLDAIVKQLEPLKDDIEISEGCKTHLIDVWIACKYQRPTKDIKSKYIEKGLMLEEHNITTYGKAKGVFYEKCLERKDDGFIMGEIDFEDPTVIYDIKSSWDLWTFKRNIKFIDKPESSPYYPNMQGYMKLWEKHKSKLIYVLEDTPKKLIDREKKILLYDFVGTDEMYEEACAEIEKNLTYGDIPVNEKVIEVVIERDDDYIKDIQKVVIACRNYLNTIKDTYYEMD